MSGRRLRGDVKHDGGRSLVQESLDKLRKSVWILEAGAWVEASDAEEFSVALHLPIYQPSPYVLTLSPPSDLDSRHAPTLLFASGQRQYRHALTARMTAGAPRPAEDTWR